MGAPTPTEPQVVHPLYYWPPGMDLGTVKGAFEKLNLGIKVQPYSSNLVSTVGKRVLAIGSKPHWVCDYVYIDSPTSERFGAALKWALHIEELSHGPNLATHQLKKLLGDGVKEVV